MAFFKLHHKYQSLQSMCLVDAVAVGLETALSHLVTVHDKVLRARQE